MSPSKIIFYFCICFTAGIFLSSIIKIPLALIWGIFIISVLLIIIPLFFNKNLLVILGFCLLILILGVIRIPIAQFNIANNKLAKLNGWPDKIILTGVIIDEPDIREVTQKLKIKIADDVALITTNKYPEYNYLDQVKITGKVQAPMETEDFSYKNYLLPQGIYSVMDFPKIEILGRKKANLIEISYAGILYIKGKLRESLNRISLPPESLVMRGMILGDRAAIPADLKAKLSVTGVSHIIAVSGQHIVILISMLLAFLLYIGISRNQAFYFSAVFIIFYIILVGLPASGIRAGIMGIIFLLAQKLGRQSANLRIIVFACALMLLQNPLLLLYDIGFQLSFAAVLALILLEPILRNSIKLVIKKIFQIDIKEKFDKAIMVFTATLSAQIFTIAIIVFNFGNFSFVSPLVNILVLPFAELIMFFGFLAASIGIISSSLGWIVSLPCYLMIKYFLFVVDAFSKPWAYKILKDVHWGWLVFYYFLLAIFLRFLHKKSPV